MPYLLTANHCFNNQPAATSLEAVFQYVRASCNGPEPSPVGFPRTLGSTLLATGEQSDFTLVRLVGAAARRQRLSRLDDERHRVRRRHDPLPAESPRRAAAVLHEGAGERPAHARDLHWASIRGTSSTRRTSCGGTGGGSSGSLLYLQNLQVVGQEAGACGTDVQDDCDVVVNSTIDGAFRVTFPSVQPWLSPGTPGPCTPSATTLCLNGGRFRVTVAWATNTGEAAPGRAWR